MNETYVFDDYKPYPIHIILGDPGVGKSLFAVYMAWLSSRDKYLNEHNVQIFANFKMFNIPNYHYVRAYKYKDKDGKWKAVNDLIRGIAEDGTPIRNGIIFWDEPQSSGINSHHFFNKDTEELATFVSQIRKDDLALFLITQRDNFVVWNVRQLTSFIYEIHPVEKKGQVKIVRRNAQNGQLIDKNPIIKDLSHWFTYYNSKEKIGIKGDD